MKNIDNNMPKRKLKKTFRSVTGFFPSMKNGRSMAFESLLERQLFLSLEFDNSVKNYLEQPIKLEYMLNGKKTSYHPDCLVRYYDGRQTLYEVKYTDDLKKYANELAIKFEIAKKYAESNDMVFDIFTEENTSLTEIKNHTFLYAFSSVNVSLEDYHLIRSIVASTIPISIFELMNKLSNSRYEQAKKLPAIWKMVFDGALDINYKSVELTMDSVIIGSKL